MKFNTEQLDKLSGLFMDLAKGLFLAALAVPAFSSEVSTIISIQSTVTGIFFTLISLKILEWKGVA